MANVQELFNSLSTEQERTYNVIVEELEMYLNGTLSEKYPYLPEMYNGHRLIGLFTAETVRRVYQMPVEEGTVFLGGFPKSGINWTGAIIRDILYGHDEKLMRISKSLAPTFSFLGMGPPEKVDLLQHIALPRKLYLTHLPEELVNYDNIKKQKCKVVVIVRNPKDQAVSWFHYSKIPHFDAIRDEISADWNNFLSEYMQGKHPLHSKPGEGYMEYLRGWYEHKGDENIAFFHFKDMKKTPEQEIKKLAKFLKVELTDERIKGIAEKATISAMKKDEDGTSMNRVLKKHGLIRRGEVGSWKEVFTVAQSELIDKMVEKKLENVDIKFTYQ